MSVYNCFAKGRGVAVSDNKGVNWSNFFGITDATQEQVNEEYENVNYVLKNKDRVFLKTDEHSSIDRTNWDEIAKTSYAIKKIKEYKRKRVSPRGTPLFLAIGRKSLDR